MTERSEPSDPSPRSLPLVALVLLVGIVVVRAPVIAGGKTWADLRYHTEVAPPRLAAAEAIQSGQLPMWWEGSGLGVPLAAEVSHGAMYPPTWLASSPRALDLLAIAHLVWAALGVALWARRRSRPLPNAASEPAVLVAGLLVATSGIVASAAIRGALPALAHLPWVGLCAGALVDANILRERARAALGLALALGAIALAGVFAIAVDAIAIAIVIGARARTLPWLAAAIAAGVAIGLAQWLPAILHAGELAGTGTVEGLPLARLVELIVPASFGATDPARGVAAIAGATAWAPSLFVGAPLLALAAVRPPTTRGLAIVVGLAALALVVGRGGWPAWLGSPELHVAALAIVLGPHAAAGLDALVSGDRRAVISLGVGAACAGVALGAVFAQKARHPDAATAIDRALLDGALGLVCMIGAVVLGWRASRARVVPRLASPLPRGQAALVLALLVLPTVGATPSIAPVMERSLVEDPPAFAAAVRARPETAAPRRVFRPQYMFAFEDDRRDTETIEDALATFAGASGWRWGIGAARSEDPARSPLHDRFWLAAANEGGALLDRFGIGLAILPETVVLPRKLAPLGQRGKWALVELPVAPPAGVLYGSLWSMDPDNAMTLMYPGGGGMGVLPGTTVLRGRASEPPRPDRGPPRACPVESWEPGAIELSCTADAPAYAVVSSSAARGWEVAVDGEPAPWLVADVLRRAVEIPAGTHRIEWRYRTPGLVAGGLVAIVVLLGMLALAITTRRPRAKSRD